MNDENGATAPTRVLLLGLPARFLVNVSAHSGGRCADGGGPTILLENNLTWPWPPLFTLTSARGDSKIAAYLVFAVLRDWPRTNRSAKWQFLPQLEIRQPIEYVMRGTFYVPPHDVQCQDEATTQGAADA